jgi:putative membrane protein
MAPLVAWSAWEPYDTITWWMEVAPVFLGFMALFIAERRNWRLSNLALGLVAIHMILLLVGGHYTYARVPAGAWVSEILGLTRNHYDRLGHLAQGFVPAILCREVFLRNQVVNGGWLGFCVFSFCLAFSATYELIEWLAAIISAEAAESFLGTQGDSWDTQWDMFLAATGALLALVSLSRIHDKSIHRLLATSPWLRKEAA